MADFSMQDAAFTGFGVVRRNPSALLAWAALALAFSLAVDFVYPGAAADPMAAARLATTDPTSPQAQKLLLQSAALAGFSLVIQAFISAAMMRSVLRPEDGGLGYLRVGPDEARQLGLSLLFAALLTALAFGASIIAGLVLALTGAGGGAVLIVLPLVATGAGALAVRFSLAAPLTFVRRRVDLFGSLPLTRGRFWPLAGTYLLALALALMVQVLSALFIGAVTAIASGGDLAAAFAPDSGGPLTPAHALRALLAAFVSALVWPLLFTPSAAVFQRISLPA